MSSARSAPSCPICATGAQRYAPHMQPAQPTAPAALSPTTRLAAKSQVTPACAGAPGWQGAGCAQGSDVLRSP